MVMGNPTHIKIGKAQIDLDTMEISGPAGTHSVEPKVMDVLSVLIKNAGQVVTREDLIDQVWGVGYGGDERLSRAISLLRKALGDRRGRHRCIQTIPRRGYKLAASVVRVQSDADVAENIISTEFAEIAPKKNYWIRIVTSMAAALIAVTAPIYYSRKNAASAPPASPLVMIMDSAHPARIYDEDVKANGATNADILSDILADLPIRTQKELISPSWHRYEAITQFDPDLIVIHYSGFKQEDASGDRPQLRLLVEYFQKTDTEFLIYSRAGQDWLDGNMNIILEEAYTQNPELKARIDIFPLLEYGEPNWKDQATAQGIKLKIKDILELEN